MQKTLTSGQKFYFLLLRSLSPLFPAFVARRLETLFLTPQRFERTAEENQFWQSGQALAINNGSTARLFGTAGPLLVFVHGWEGRGSRYFKWVPPLLERGYQVLLWDSKAHGDSKGQQTNLIQNLIDLADTIKENSFKPYAMIGHSLGAAVVLTGLAWGELEAQKAIAICGPSNSKDVIDRFLEQMAVSSRAKKRFRQRILKSFDVTYEDLDLRKIGHQIQIPILIIHDEKDKELSISEGEALHKGIPRSVFIRTEGLGHRRILLDPEVIQLSVDFLSTGSSAGGSGRNQI